jgi:CHAT domain-containing protein
LAFGSITEVDASALVVGHFQGVPPQNAELAIDRAIGSVIKDFDNRRMIRGDLGQLFFIPTLRTRLYASTVVLVGLGNFANFTQDSLELVGINLIKGMLGIKVYDFGMVLLGSGAGNLPVGVAFRSIMQGLYEGLQRYDLEGKPWDMTLAVRDKEKHRTLRSLIPDFLKKDPLARSLNVVFSEATLPESKRPGTPVKATKEVISENASSLLPLTIIVQADGPKFVFSALGEAATLRKEQIISEEVIEGAMQKFEDSYGNPQAEEIQKNQGKLLFNEIIPEDIQKVIFSNKNRAIVLALDSYAATVPWELMYVEHPVYPGFLGLNFPVGRQLIVDTSVTKWLAKRKIGRKLDFLLIGDPTGNLSGAAAEVEELSELLRSQPDIQVTTRIGPEENDAIKILGEIGSGKYDIIHYAGHAYFDDRNPLESAWIFKEGGRVRARDLIRLSSLPALIFSNACEAGVIGRRIHHTDKYGVAEALLRAGLINYIGTFWQISDAPGAFFAGKFYENLLKEKYIGESLMEARRGIIQKYGYQELVWGSYMLYGNAAFRFKMS